ncbi:uncharacterized protein LOC103579322 isoform X3 [Microplitis demolitor]|uniref:uncharacterized protein LOC103579322 isoform X3 n=1 Tax=Microplitis demolitor TaxID=69319 RepID=UPI0006D526CB|nr:uncharacterized protein LOC103579322 isoform X3 [Microplitis demolitor]
MAQGTPESDVGSFECFTNYTAPEVFIQGLAGLVDQQDVESMIRAQKQMLQRFEKTNEMLTNCNQLSISRLKSAGAEFKKHTALLAEMKKDLDYIFKKIRIVKNKLNQQYPQAFNEAVRSSLAEEVLVEDINQGPKPLEPEIITPVINMSTATEKDQDPDSDVPVEEFQFAKLRKRQLKRKDDSSSTDSNNDHSNADDSSDFTMKAEGSTTPIVVSHKVKIKEEVKECESQELSLSFEKDLPLTVTTTAINESIITASVTTSTIQTSTITINNSSNSSKKPTTIDNTNSVVSLIAKESLSSDLKCKEVLYLVNRSQENVSEEKSHDREDNISSSPTNCSLLKQKLSHHQQQKSSLVEINNGQKSLSLSTENQSPKAISIKIEDQVEDPSAMTGGADKIQENLTITENNKCDLSSSNAKNNNGPRCIANIFTGHTKFRRLLGTLVQFANNISNDTGDTVRTLIFGLLSGGLAVEEFHTSLQEVTNFPLRDFVLPYLKHTLPLLRRNITAAARFNNQTCAQYLRCNESAILETISLTVPSGEIVQLFGDYNNSSSSSSSSNNSSGSLSLHHYNTGRAVKRRASDTLYYENGVEDPVIYGKRPVNSWNHSQHQQQQQQQQLPDSYCLYHSSSGNTVQNNLQTSGYGNNLLPPNLIQINQSPSFSSYHRSQQQQQQQLNYMTASAQNISSLDDEWKNIHVMLNCILGMVDKTKRALVILQKRGSSSPCGGSSSSSSSSTTTPTVTNVSQLISSTQNLSSNNSNHNCLNGSQVETSGDRDGNLKRLSGEIIAQTIRATQDRVTAEVKRHAEEAVQEVKRVAMAEVQRAVAAAVTESQVNERLGTNQQHFDSSVLPLKNYGNIRQGSFFRLNSHLINQNIGTTVNSNLSRENDKEAIYHLSNSTSSCWNCGRSAMETCGGCGIARYCSSFCQHRDWEIGGHHVTCRHTSPPTSESRRSSSRSPPRVVTLTQNDVIGVPNNGANLSNNITQAK